MKLPEIFPKTIEINESEELQKDKFELVGLSAKELGKTKKSESEEELKIKLIEYLNKKIPDFSFHQADNFSNYNKNYILDLGDYNRIEFNENRILRGGTPGCFSPEEWKKLEETYSYDFIRETMEKIFEEKVIVALDSFIVPGQNDDQTKKFKDMVQIKFLPMAKRMIDLTLRHKELKYKAQIQGLDNIGNIRDLEILIKKLEFDKQEAQRILNEIEQIENEIPNEKIIFNGIFITIPSYVKKYNEFRQESEKKRKQLEDIESKITKLEKNKPLFYGKKKWNDDLAELNEEKEILKKQTNINKIQQESGRLYKKAYLYIPNTESSKGQPKPIGDSMIDLNNLKKRLKDIINQDTELTLQLRTEFSDLVQI
jgi:hypothetical protein